MSNQWKVGDIFRSHRNTRCEFKIVSISSHGIGYISETIGREFKADASVYHVYHTNPDNEFIYKVRPVEIYPQRPHGNRLSSKPT